MRAELQRPDTVQTLRRKKLRMEEERCEILRVRIHLAGKSLHQLGDELLHESFALLGNQPDWDEVAGAVEHFPQLLLFEFTRVNIALRLQLWNLGFVGHEGVSCLPNHLLADLAHLHNLQMIDGALILVAISTSSSS